MKLEKFRSREIVEAVQLDFDNDSLMEEVKEWVGGQFTKFEKITDGYYDIDLKVYTGYVYHPEHSDYIYKTHHMFFTLPLKSFRESYE